jgi:hypothetical protein
MLISLLEACLVMHAEAAYYALSQQDACTVPTDCLHREGMEMDRSKNDFIPLLSLHFRV